MRWLSVALIPFAVQAVACGGEAPQPAELTGATGTAATTSSTTGGGDGGAGGAGDGGAGGSTDVGGGDAVSYPDPDWPTATPAEVGLDAAQLDVAAQIAEDADSHCLVVIRHGKLVYERYWQGHDVDTPQISWSIAKSHAATLVGIAIERGDLGSLDDSVADYVPEWQGTANEAITLRHVITMTTGLEWSAFDDYFKMAFLSQDHTAHAIGLDPDVPAGSEWTYHNGGVQILEPVFRAATGMSIEDYAEAHLWSRIGVAGAWKHDPADNPTAYASVLASCRDHARLGYLFRHGGVWAGEQVVPAEFVTDALTPSQAMNPAYGYLWWLNGQTPVISPMGEVREEPISTVVPPDMFAMRGFGNQFVDVIPSLDMIVVRFGPDAMNDFDVQRLIEEARFSVHEEIMEPVMAAVEPPP